MPNRAYYLARDLLETDLITLTSCVGSTILSVREKPHFQHRIDPRDLFRVFVVEPQQSFERLRAQSGAFLISAFHERFEQEQILECNKFVPTYEHYILLIPPECKNHILAQLRLLNITQDALFPGLDEAAKAITNERTI